MLLTIRTTTVALCFGALLLLAACAHDGHTDSSPNATQSPQPNTSQNENHSASQTATQSSAPTGEATSAPVRASAGEVKLSAGGAGEAAVRLDIAEGYHVNANPPSDKFLVGTQLDVSAGEGITPGRPVYPAPLSKKFSFSEKPLAVYEGGAVIRLPLRADASATRGQHTLSAKVRVQPCNDQACLPPRTLEASIPVNVN